MRQDILTKGTVDRRKGGTIVYKMERGVAGDLLFILSGGTWNHKDIITVKLRHSAGVDVVVDRMPALLLAMLCDTKKGRPNTGTGDTIEEGEEQTQESKINPGAVYAVNAFKIPIGHITLADAKSELEISVDVAKAFGTDVTVKIANIEPKSGPDYLLQYDKSYDLESTHLLVRELWIYGKGGKSFFNTDYANAGVVSGKDISVMLYPSIDGAYETDIEVLGANTSIDGELSHPVNSLVCAYSDNEPLPTPALRVKVTGDDASIAGLLFIKEKMIQAMTSVSTIAQVDRVLQKTEAIEKMGDGTAKAYRHAGSARTSQDVVAIKDALVAKTPEA
jgi:hypothetical protein